MQKSARKCKRVCKGIKRKGLSAVASDEWPVASFQKRKMGYTLRHDENSAKVDDYKGVVGWPLRRRACNHMKRKGLNREAAEMEMAQEEKIEFGDRQTRGSIARS